MSRNSPEKTNVETGPANWSDIQFLSTISQNVESTLYKVHKLPDVSTFYVCKKIFLNHLVDNQRWRGDDLEQNLRAITRLVHPHIIKCHKFSITSSLLYLVFDYYSMGSVQDRLNKSKRPLPLKVSRVWFAQILGAVSYIHTRGVAHRNIKLTAILLKSEEHAILSGFTHHVCLAYRRDADIMRSTVFNRNLAYRAPEMHSLLAQVWPYDAKAADVYSLGVCLFQMVNFDLPFNVDLYSTDQVAYINKQRNREYTYRDRYAAHSNSKIRHLISLLLEPKPGIRTTANSALLHEALLPD